MSLLLRFGLAIGALAGTFAAGFYLKPTPPVRYAAAAPPASQPAAAPIHDPQVKPAVVLGAPEPADPLDAAGMAMIRKEMALQTTILDKSEPVPAVLVEARRRRLKEEENSPQVCGPGVLLDNMAVAQQPSSSPVPTGGPMPRLDPPPLPDIPRINVSPPPPPPSIHVPPLGSATRPVNDRNVALDFALTRTGSSPVKAVELWTTRDGGATWAKTDRMTGCASPFRTRLGSDGQYGFRMVFESEAGMRSPEPKPGESADQTIWLDTTPPRIADLSLGPVPGAPDKVRVRWTMTDGHLDYQRVRIEYSTDGRTWLPAAIDPNVPHDSKVGTSRAWKVPPGLPHRVMLRVTVRDTAGNETTAELPQPVSIDLVAPAGKVTGLHGPGLEVGPTPREVGGPSAAMRLAAPLAGLLGSPSPVSRR